MTTALILLLCTCTVEIIANHLLHQKDGTIHNNENAEDQHHKQQHEKESSNKHALEKAELRSSFVDKPEITDQLKVLDFRYEGPYDVVYLWLDPSDKLWQHSYQSFGYMFDPARFISSNELELSLITASAMLQNVRNVFIVMCDTNRLFPLEFLPQSFVKKIKVIYHSEIIDAKYLPLFSANALESNIWKIPGLSEYFLYMNDDMFPTRPFDLKRSNVWTQNKESMLIVPSALRSEFCSREYMHQKAFPEPHWIMYVNTVNVFHERYGYCVPFVSIAHYPYFLSKTLLNVTVQIFPEYFDQLERNRLRSYAPFQHNKSWGGETLFLYLSLYVGHHYRKVRFTPLYYMTSRISIPPGVHVTKETFTQLKLNTQEPSNITNIIIGNFINQEVDFMTIQHLYKISNAQFRSACGHMIYAACRAVKNTTLSYTFERRHASSSLFSEPCWNDPFCNNSCKSCQDLEYFKFNICNKRSDDMSKKIEQLSALRYVSNKNPNIDKPLRRSTEIPAIKPSVLNDYKKYHSKSTNFTEIMKNSSNYKIIRDELSEVFATYDQGVFDSIIHREKVEKLQVTVFKTFGNNNFSNHESFWKNQSEIIRTHSELKDSDVIFLIDLDDGMSRSKNVDVAHSMANLLKMHYVYAVEFMYLSDLVPARGMRTTNRTGLRGEGSQGSKGYSGHSILSKFPLDNIQLVHYWDTDRRSKDLFRENRVGDRLAIIASLPLENLGYLYSNPASRPKNNSVSYQATKNHSIDLVVTRLETKRSERSNIDAIKLLAEVIRKRDAKGGAIIAGDFSNPFSGNSEVAEYLFQKESFRSPWATNTRER